MSGAVAHIQRFKDGFYFSKEFVGENSWNGYERKCLFLNVGGGRFLDVARALGTDAETDGRGVAIADLDGDGRQDIVMSNNNGPPTIYLNRLEHTGNWTRLTLQGGPSNRDAIGARVRLTVRTADGARTLLRQVEAGSGYASQSESTVHFGLGASTVLEAVDVWWPSGREQHFAGADLNGLVNRAVFLRESGALERTRPGVAEQRARR